jgi:hypothetical protein
MRVPRIAIPEPTLNDLEYNERSWPQYAHAVEVSGGIAVKIPLTATPAEVAQLPPAKESSSLAAARMSIQRSTGTNGFPNALPRTQRGRRSMNYSCRMPLIYTNRSSASATAPSPGTSGAGVL